MTAANILVAVIRNLIPTKPVKGEPPKRVRWTIQQGGEVKKQGELRSATSKQGDHVSEGQVKGGSPCPVEVMGTVTSYWVLSAEK